MAETFYDVLGVSRDATTEEIEHAYRERIKETHPDVSDEADAQDRVRKVIEAKEVLTDADEREQYDSVGHAAYVGDNVDADWADAVDVEETTPDAGTDDEPREEPGPGSGAESVHEGTWADTGTGSADTDADSNGTSRHSADADADSDSAGVGGSATAAASETASAGGTGPTNSGVDGGHRRSSGDLSEEEKRRRSTASNVGETVGWAAGVDGRHAVRNGTRRRRIRSTKLFPPEQSMVLLVSTFVIYPSLVYSTFTPLFPFAVNLVVGLCTLFLVGYLVSMPDAGVYVFGAWSGLATLGLLLFGVSPLSLVGVLVVCVTYVPLALTLAVYAVLRW
ncbi:DnaJ domain-containing protein [Halapricum sp. CBA1109]|uniref:J domain-containing protein n=1 Tax=Halapricum sp. CBA1109 TaxID=2668068 RepID=UPI0012F9DA25|nr:DnaJ domain-containing protein [Halapricum sp. CBA1109]MUV89948.1 DnaJ domain-containing protein [Halapricum sp. CBA1109]